MNAIGTSEVEVRPRYTCCHPNAKGYAEVWLPSVLPHFKEICGK